LERVAAVFEQERTAQKIKRLVESAGGRQVLCCATAAEARLLLDRQRVAAVVCGYKFPDGTAEELFFDLRDGPGMLLLAPEHLLVLCRDSPGLFKRSTPLRRSDVLDGVGEGVRWGNQLRRPAAEAELIRRAKEWLMERYGMDEETAHRALQKRSMDQGLRLAQTARDLLERAAGIALF